MMSKADIQTGRRIINFLAGMGGALFLLLFAASALAADPDADRKIIPLPHGYLFGPLIADPKQPRFSTSVLHASLPAGDTTAVAVSFGEDFGLVRWPGRSADTGVQISIAGAVFSQFDLGAPSSDLINADYVIGFPVTYRREALSARFRLYHQSSHLGDEFLLRGTTARVNLSFESAELLLSYEQRQLRLYGGGEYLFRREPSRLDPGLIHGGIEYRYPRPVMRVLVLGSGFLVAAVDIKSWEQDDWSPAFSLKFGLEFGPVDTVGVLSRHWNLLLEWYKGFTPYGQFFTEDVSYFGLGIQLSL